MEEDVNRVSAVDMEVPRRVAILYIQMKVELISNFNSHYSHRHPKE